MNKQLFSIAVLVCSISPINSHAQSLYCGMKPIPQIGCHIGRCVNGRWEQVCGSNSYGSSGSRLDPGLLEGVSRVPPPYQADVSGAFNRGRQRAQQNRMNQQQIEMNRQQIEMNQQMLEMMRNQNQP